MSEFDDLGSEEARLPSITGLEGVTDPAIKKVLQSMKEMLEIRAGQRPRASQLDRALTFRDLYKYNIASFDINGQSVSNPNPLSGVTPVVQTTPAQETVENLTKPGAPTGLIVTGTEKDVLVEWDAPIGNIAYTEIFRSDVNDIGKAVSIGLSIGSIYGDIIGQAGITYFYWIRFISDNNITGDFNAITGSPATTGDDLGAAPANKLIDATILNLKVSNVSADKITTGTLRVGQAIAVGTAENRIFIDGNGIIRTGGMLDFLNGIGFWLGVTGGEAKFSIGDGEKYVAWDGTNIRISGNISNGQSAYNSGYGMFSGTDADGFYKFSIGNGSNQYINWDGNNLLVKTNNFEITPDAFTFNGTGTFSGNLNAATGSFGGQLMAGVLDFSELEGVRQVYYTPGVYTITVPVGKTTLRATLGSASGGGAGAGNVNASGGGAGGSGGILIVTFNGLTAGATYTLTVGARGLKGARAPWNGSYNNYGQNGTNGGNTAITGLATCVGGRGGERGGPGTNIPQGGAGGTNGQEGGDGTLATQATVTPYNVTPGVGGLGGVNAYGVNGGRGGDAAANVNNSEDGDNGFAFIEFFNPNSVVLQTSYNTLLSALQRQGIAIV